MTDKPNTAAADMARKDRRLPASRPDPKAAAVLKIEREPSFA
jgi:hypothetical protein